MKLIIWMASVILLTTVTAHAQQGSNEPLYNNTTPAAIPATPAGADDSTIGKPTWRNDINIFAVRDFVKRFDDPANARWYKIGQEGYVIKFEEPGTSYRVSYNSRGAWVYTIKTYTEKQMPRDIRRLVKTTYFDDIITQVEEIEQINGNSAYKRRYRL
jgi:hypothetical protein